MPRSWADARQAPFSHNLFAVSASAILLADGSVLVFAGTSDMGQGARTIFAQVAANEMGVPLDRVSVVMGDTAVVPYDQQTSASRSTLEPRPQLPFRRS